MNDIEIYIRDPKPAALETWLASHFEGLTLKPFPNGKGYSGVGAISGTDSGTEEAQRVPVKIFLNAVGKYASVLFESANTPWPDDLSCARDAWQALGKETRCATGEWHENTEEESDLWWSINADGEKQVRWQV